MLSVTLPFQLYPNVSITEALWTLYHSLEKGFSLAFVVLVSLYHPREVLLFFLLFSNAIESFVTYFIEVSAILDHFNRCCGKRH